MAVGIALIAALLIAIGWVFGGSGKTTEAAVKPGVATGHGAPIPPATPIAVAPIATAPAPTASAVIAALPHIETTVSPAASATALQNNVPPTPVASNTELENKPSHPPALLQQRLTATQELLAKQSENGTSIQLFYTTEAQSARIEGFLARANALGKLSDIYVLPVKINGKDGFRVLYGAYSNATEARAGMKQLPQRYKQAFVPAPYMLDGAQTILHRP